MLYTSVCELDVQNRLQLSTAGQDLRCSLSLIHSVQSPVRPKMCSQPRAGCQTHPSSWLQVPCGACKTETQMLGKGSPSTAVWTRWCAVTRSSSCNIPFFSYLLHLLSRKKKNISFLCAHSWVSCSERLILFMRVFVAATTESSKQQALHPKFSER